MSQELELRKAMPAPPAPVVTIPIAVCVEDAAEMDGEVWGFMEDLREQNRSATGIASLCVLCTQDPAVVVRLLLAGSRAVNVAWHNGLSCPAKLMPSAGRPEGMEQAAGWHGAILFCSLGLS